MSTGYILGGSCVVVKLDQVDGLSLHVDVLCGVVIIFVKLLDTGSPSCL